MVLRIEQSDLQAKLMEHAGEIGPRPWAVGLLDFIAGVSYIAAAFVGGYPIAVVVILVVLALFPTLYGLWGVWDWCRHHEYDVYALIEDIKAMDRTERQSSIVAVRDAENELDGRYLIYRDKGWDCDFFPNHPTAETQDVDENNLVRYLSTEFKIPAEDFTLRLVTGGVESVKPSTEHDGEVRYYVYQLYVADVHRIPEAWRHDSFRAGSKDCKWMTLDEMVADARTNEINHDVIAMVGKYL